MRTNLIREARRRAGMSQAELARRTGVPQSVLSAYERGRRQPGVDAVARIVEAVGFGLRLGTRRPDADRAGRVLRDVLTLVDRIPSRRRGPLRYPRIGL